MRASPIQRLTRQLTDPFGFHDAFHDLRLVAEDLPGLTRECRQAGAGC